MIKHHFVLDSFAYFAYLNEENGAELIEKLINKSLNNQATLYLHRINWGEVYYKTYKEKSRKDAEEAIKKLEDLSINAVDEFSIEFIKKVCVIKGQFTVSYADAFAAQLAIAKKIPLVTGDPELTKLSSRLPGLNLLWV